ncbi:MAG: DUF6129 family protein [Methylococcaceae bacterium]
MITSDQLQVIADTIAEQPLNDEIVTFLRAQFPDIHFTYCMDDDVSGVLPKFENSRFNLYLVDGREHCLSMTNNHEIATGVLVTEVIDD